MRIAFGWYSFRIKAYKPSELGLQTAEYQSASIEVRQRCFHLFFIPVFGIGKIYSLRKDGRLYELPQELIEKVQKKGKLGTPFYTYAFPILAALFFVSYLIYGQLMNLKNKNLREKEYDLFLNQVQREINRLSTDHYIKIVDFKNYGETDELYLKVEKISGDSLKLFVINVEEENDLFMPSVSLLPQFYNKNKGKLDSIAITKTDLLNAVCRDDNEFYDKTAVGENLLNDSHHYVIESIESLKGPILRVESSGAVDKITIKNYGSAIKLLEIQQIDNHLSSPDQLPLLIGSPGIFYLTVNNYSDDFHYRSKLIFQDSLNNKYSYFISGKEFRKKLERSIGL